MFIYRKTVSLVKSFDYFGYNVELNFGTAVEKDADGDAVHKTAYSGFLSFAVNCLLLYFIYFFLW